MADIKFRVLYEEGVSEQIDNIDMELDDISPRKKEYMLLWLREKGKRARVGDEGRELPLYQGAEFIDNMVRAVRDEYYPEFDQQYMDWLYDCARSDGFSEENRQMLAEYVDEKRTLAEISQLVEHLTPDEVVDTIGKVLREEPKTLWYDELIADCNDSVILRKYYSRVFGVPENEVVPAKPENLPEPKTVVYMSLADGAEPEPVMFVKNIRDGKSDKEISVFCHADPFNDGELEYFTVSLEEAAFIPMALRMENDSNMDRLSLWAKERIDFSDDVYLEKPSATEIAARYQRKGLANGKAFEKGFQALSEKFRQAKVWTFGKGEHGEMVAAAPAYAKLAAYRLLMEQFEMTGGYNIPVKKLVSFMQDEVHKEYDCVEKIFGSMRIYAERTMAGKETRERADTRERDMNALRPKDNTRAASVEK